MDEVRCNHDSQKNFRHIERGKIRRLARKTGTFGIKITVLVTITPANNREVDGGVVDGKRFRVYLQLELQRCIHTERRV